MNGTKKIKYSRTDQIILGIAYVFWYATLI